jgi:hypothetical protein
MRTYCMYGCGSDVECYWRVTDVIRIHIYSLSFESLRQIQFLHFCVIPSLKLD